MISEAQILKITAILRWMQFPLLFLFLRVNILIDTKYRLKFILERFKMLNKIFTYYKNLDKTTYKILYKGLEFCFLLASFSAFILLSYMVFFEAPLIYYIGISLFKLSLVFSVEFIICSFVVDSIKKQLI